MNAIFKKTLPFVIPVIALKIILVYIIENNFINIKTIDFSDIAVIFTGAFFVMGMLLAGTMSDFKESEKIPGEIACNLEAINDWIHLGVEVNKISSNPKTVDEKEYYNMVKDSTKNIIDWIESKEKDSTTIFSLLKKFNEIALEFALNNFDKEAIKGIQENTNVLRKQLTRTYTIARTNFISAAYFLLQSILFITIPLLLICQFKSIVASILVTAVLSFVFLYLYFLIKGLDNPFDFSGEDTEVDLMPLIRFRDRINN